MALYDRLLLNFDDQQDVDGGWFGARRAWSRKPVAVQRLRMEEIDALETFHKRITSVEATAHMITRPISTTPVPSLNTLSDYTVALWQLWELLQAALVQWPLAWTSDLIQLLETIAQIPDKIHRGEDKAIVDGEQLTWKGLPYFGAVWYEYSHLQPGQIVRKASAEGAVAMASSRIRFFKDKHIEAQLVAARVLPVAGRVYWSLLKTFQQPDEEIATNEGIAFEQNRLDFQVPAFASLVHYAGSEVWEYVVQQKDGEQLWASWKRRLVAIAETESNDFTKTAAESAHHDMDATELRARTGNA